MFSPGKSTRVVEARLLRARKRECSRRASRTRQETLWASGTRPSAISGCRFVQMLYATACNAVVISSEHLEELLRNAASANVFFDRIGELNLEPKLILFPAQPIAIAKFALCASGSGLPPIRIVRSFRQGRDSSPHFQIRAVDRVRRSLRCGINCPPIYERHRCPWCRTRVSPNHRARSVAVREHSNQP